MVWLVLVLTLIGWKTGASLLSQSLSLAIAITELLSTVIWQLLHYAQRSHAVSVCRKQNEWSWKRVVKRKQNGGQFDSVRRHSVFTNEMEESMRTVPVWAYTPQKRSVSTSASFFQVKVNLNYFTCFGFHQFQMTYWILSGLNLNLILK